jgi:hypothetical protein
MIIPKCKECFWYAYEKGLVFNKHYCDWLYSHSTYLYFSHNSYLKQIHFNDQKTSPQWCPKRK